MELVEPRRRTAFVTFYSFKGGVGRTMALANTAAILAGRNRRVLMIDFDLEAPGLTYLGRQLAASEEAPEGLVELITEFLQDPENSALADTTGERFFSRYVQELVVPKWTSKLEGGYLHLITSGRTDDSYASRLNQIDFNQLYQEGIGLPMFRLFKKLIRESGRYDYVLVDSRTGFSDEAGICSRDLADHNVVLSGLNRQNVRGTASFLKRLKASGWKGSIQFVATPVPVGYEDLRDERLEEAHAAFKDAGYKPDEFLRVPYHPRLALDEDPFLYPWSNTDLGEAYERIQRRVRSFANDRPADWSRLAWLGLREGETERSLELIRELWIEDPGAAESVASFAIGTGSEQIANFKAFYPRLFQLWLKVAPSVSVYQRYAQLLWQDREWDAALHQLRIAGSLADKSGDEGETASVSFSFGLFYAEQKKFADAAGEFARSAAMLQKIEDRENECTAIYNWGNALADLARMHEGEERERLFREAIEKYAAAVAIESDKHEALYNWGNTLSDLAFMYEGAERENFIRGAIEQYAVAVAIKPDKDEALNNWGVALVNLAWMHEGAERERLLREAIHQYAAAGAVKPDDADIRYSWGRTLAIVAELQQGSERERLFREAIHQYAAAVAVKPDFHEALSNRGAALAALARMLAGPERERLFREAIQQYATAVAVKPDFHEALSNWGVVLAALAEMQPEPERAQLLREATTRLEQAEAIAPGTYSYNLACAASLRGDLDHCRAWLEKSHAFGTLEFADQLAGDTDLDAVRHLEWFQDFLHPAPTTEPVEP